MIVIISTTVHIHIHTHTYTHTHFNCVFRRALIKMGILWNIIGQANRTEPKGLYSHNTGGMVWFTSRRAEPWLEILHVAKLLDIFIWYGIAYSID